MDWQLTCRVCLETGDMVSLFDWDENNEQLGNKYTYICGVEVPKNDSLPTLICLPCVDRLTYAYQFKQQCLSSNDTLKECLEEFEKSSHTVVPVQASSSKAETEIITIKQENGLLLQYELPVEVDPPTQWTNINSRASAVHSKSPGPKKRGRPRKYPDEKGRIDISPYQRKRPRNPPKEEESIKSMLESIGGDISADLKQEPMTEDDGNFEEDFHDADDSTEYTPQDEEDSKNVNKTPKKRGRPRKIKEEVIKPEVEDVLLKETIMAFSEPIPEHILKPKPKKKYPKRYVYEKTHTCETCGASFTSNASLQAHIRRHLGIKPFVCSVCGYSCVMKEALKRHMLRHTGERPYKCRICERRFGDYGTRQKHESVCNYSCVLNEELKRHMLRHTGEKPYKCRICERRFGDYGTRQKHERLHMGLRPYQCTLCSKSFTYSYVLTNHMLTHTGEKKYSCAPCNKKFTKAHHLKYHNKVHHKDIYLQQQIEATAAKNAKNIPIAGMLTGQIVDGTLHLVHATPDDSCVESSLHVVEEEDRETHSAVANMQAEVLDAEFSMDDDVKEN